MDLDDVAAALAERLETIPGLRVSSEVPQAVNPPVAVVGLGAGTFDTLDHLGKVEFGILVLLSSSNTKGAQKALRGYCAANGAQSIRAALESDAFELSLGGNGVGANVLVRGWSAPAVVTVGPTDYIGVEFNVDVIE